MITTVCANPCIDKTVFVDRFLIGNKNQVLEVREEGCGKGVTVAIVANLLGLDAACICLLPQEGNELLLKSIRNSNIEARYIPSLGSLRINTKVLDMAQNVITEINDSGSLAQPDAVCQFTEATLHLAKASDYLVLTGSTPPGFPLNYYRSVIEEVKRVAPNCKTVIDTEGERLSEGLKAIPAVFKPNRYELELLVGKKLPTIQEICKESLKILDKGVELVAVSLGAEGAFITDGSDALYTPVLNVEVKSTLGAGDSMLAGMLLALETNRDLEDVIRFGVAAATASVATPGTGLTDRGLFETLISQVVVDRVNPS